MKDRVHPDDTPVPFGSEVHEAGFRTNDPPRPPHYEGPSSWKNWKARAEKAEAENQQLREVRQVVENSRDGRISVHTFDVSDLGAVEAENTRLSAVVETAIRVFEWHHQSLETPALCAGCSTVWPCDTHVELRDEIAALVDKRPSL